MILNSLASNIFLSRGSLQPLRQLATSFNSNSKLNLAMEYTINSNCRNRCKCSNVYSQNLLNKAWKWAETKSS